MSLSLKLVRKNRNYRCLLFASATSNLGDGIALLAFPWLATLISRDPVYISFVAVATRLPWLLFSLPVGVIIDRVDRQRLMVISEIIRVVLSAATIVFVVSFSTELFTAEHLSELSAILVLCFIALLLGTAEVFRDNAAQTVMPSIVDSSQLEQANGQLWSVEQIMGSFVGPPLAGFLIAISLPMPFSFNVVAFGLSAWSLWLIQFPVRLPSAAQRNFLAELMAGVKWMRQHHVMLQLAIMLGMLNAFATMALTILVLFSQEILQLNSVWHGILLTSIAVGGVLGGVLSPMLVARVGARKSLYLALFIFPVSYLVIVFTHSAIVVGLALFVDMVASVLWNVVTVSYRQRVIPESILGRVNSIYRFFGWGMMPVGALAGGLIVSVVEPAYGREIALRLPYLFASMGCFLVFIYALKSLRDFKFVV